MARFKLLKDLIRNWISDAQWTTATPLPPAREIRDADLASLINPLFSCLPMGGEETDRAAYALGGVVQKMHMVSPENAKNVIRRFMWHMNEESGNIGWGIPEAFGQTLAQCPPLANAYKSVLFYYIYDAPENQSTIFCDYAPLRISCYKAIAILLKARPDFAEEALPLLRFAASNETDEDCKKAAEDLVRRYLLSQFSSSKKLSLHADASA